MIDSRSRRRGPRTRTRSPASPGCYVFTGRGRRAAGARQRLLGRCRVRAAGLRLGRVRTRGCRSSFRRRRARRLRFRRSSKMRGGWPDGIARRSRSPEATHAGRAPRRGRGRLARSARGQSPTSRSRPRRRVFGAERGSPKANHARASATTRRGRLARSARGRSPTNQCRRRELNPRPSAYETPALTN
jgi:hypothetical protein